MNEKIVILLRHAEAFNVGEKGISSDRDRFLTPKGVKQCARMGQWLSKNQLSDCTFYTSPYVRAKETADRVTRTMGIGEASESEAISLNTDFETVIDFCKKLPSGKFCLVGHEPLWGMVSGYLMGAGEYNSFTMPKAGAVAFEFTSYGEIRWLWSMSQKGLKDFKL